MALLGPAQISELGADAPLWSPREDQAVGWIARGPFIGPFRRKSGEDEICKNYVQ